MDDDRTLRTAGITTITEMIIFLELCCFLWIGVSLPILTFAVFTAIYLILDAIPFFRKNKYIKAALLCFCGLFTIMILVLSKIRL